MRPIVNNCIVGTLGPGRSSLEYLIAGVLLCHPNSSVKSVSDFMIKAPTMVAYDCSTKDKIKWYLENYSLPDQHPPYSNTQANGQFENYRNQYGIIRRPNIHFNGEDPQGTICMKTQQLKQEYNETFSQSHRGPALALHESHNANFEVIGPFEAPPFRIISAHHQNSIEYNNDTHFQNSENIEFLKQTHRNVPEKLVEMPMKSTLEQQNLNRTKFLSHQNFNVMVQPKVEHLVQEKVESLATPSSIPTNIQTQLSVMPYEIPKFNRALLSSDQSVSHLECRVKDEIIDNQLRCNRASNIITTQKVPHENAHDLVSSMESHSYSHQDDSDSDYQEKQESNRTCLKKKLRNKKIQDSDIPVDLFTEKQVPLDNISENKKLKNKDGNDEEVDKLKDNENGISIYDPNSNKRNSDNKRTRKEIRLSKATRGISSKSKDKSANMKYVSPCLIYQNEILDKIRGSAQKKMNIQDEKFKVSNTKELQQHLLNSLDVNIKAILKSRKTERLQVSY